MLCEPAVPIRFRLQYAVAKPRRLRAGFDVTVRGTATGTTVTRAIRVTWQIRRGNLPVVLPVLPTPEVPESVAAPFRRLAVQDPDWAMSVWAWPFDPVFGQLAQLADPGYAGHLLS
ncbi:MAG TPA: hypothetical protein VKL22_04700, partial [Actinomycetota bacterium]|nr:hypothetical protein [Actinomycetota bacterium]